MAADDLLLVAEHGESRRTPGDDRDVPVGGVHHGDVHRPLDHVVDVHHGRSLERLVALQARELDDLLDHPGQSVALGEHPPGEPLDRLRVPGGVGHRLREELDRPDGGLQLVGDVRDEVSAYRLDPALAGAVLDQRQDEARAQRRDARRDHPGRTARAGASSAPSHGSGRRGVPAGPGRRARRTSDDGRAPARRRARARRPSPPRPRRSTTRALLRRTDSTVATPAGRAGSSCGVPASC